MGYYEITINASITASYCYCWNQDLWILIQSSFRRVPIQCRLEFCRTRSLKLKISNASGKHRKNVVRKQIKKIGRQKRRFCPCPFYNRPFPSHLVPRAKPFIQKWVWFTWNWTCRANTFLLEWFHDTEANGNSDSMAFSVISDVVAAFSFNWNNCLINASKMHYHWFTFACRWINSCQFDQWEFQNAALR